MMKTEQVWGAWHPILTTLVWLSCSSFHHHLFESHASIDDICCFWQCQSSGLLPVAIWPWFDGLSLAPWWTSWMKLEGHASGVIQGCWTQFWCHLGCLGGPWWSHVESCLSLLNPGNCPVAKHQPSWQNAMCHFLLLAWAVIWLKFAKTLNYLFVVLHWKINKKWD